MKDRHSRPHAKTPYCSISASYTNLYRLGTPELVLRSQEWLRAFSLACSVVSSMLVQMKPQIANAIDTGAAE